MYLYLLGTPNTSIKVLLGNVQGNCAENKKNVYVNMLYQLSNRL